MAGFRKRYNTDQSLEEEGVWVDFGDGLKVQVRRLTSKTSREYRRKLEKPYTAQFRNREMPDSLQEELLNKQVAGIIIVNWEGVEDPDAPEPKAGEEPKMLPFSHENALKIISNPEFRDFRDDILTAAMERTTFEKEQREAARKN
jgi:hypothetical protein